MNIVLRDLHISVCTSTHHCPCVLRNIFNPGRDADEQLVESTPVSDCDTLASINGTKITLTKLPSLSR